MSGRVNARCQCAGRDPVVRLRCHGSGAAAALGGSPRHGRRAGRLRRRQIRASTGRRGSRQPPSSSSSRSGLPGWPKPNRRRWTSAPGSPARSTMCSRTASPRSRCTWRRHGLLTERGPTREFRDQMLERGVAARSMARDGIAKTCRRSPPCGGGLPGGGLPATAGGRGGAGRGAGGGEQRALTAGLLS